MKKNEKKLSKPKSNSQTVNRMRIEFSAISRNEGFARSVISAFASQLDPDIGELTEIRTAVSEAVTNCIVHGYHGNGGKIILSAEISSAGNITVKIKDNGCGIEDIEQARRPLFTSDTTGERGGMGFSIMETFTDYMKVISSPGRGTTVIMRKHVGE